MPTQENDHINDTSNTICQLTPRERRQLEREARDDHYRRQLSYQNYIREKIEQWKEPDANNIRDHSVLSEINSIIAAIDAVIAERDAAHNERNAAFIKRKAVIDELIEKDPAVAAIDRIIAEQEAVIDEKGDAFFDLVEKYLQLSKTT